MEKPAITSPVLTEYDTPLCLETMNLLSQVVSLRMLHIHLHVLYKHKDNYLYFHLNLPASLWCLIRRRYVEHFVDKLQLGKSSFGK
jgi:hypothetical protein